MERQAKLEIENLKKEVAGNHHYQVEMTNLKDTIEEKNKAVGTLNSLIEKLERTHDKNKLDIKSAFEKQNPDMKYTKFTKSFPKDDPTKKRETDPLYLAAKKASDDSIEQCKASKAGDEELKKFQKMRKDLRVEISNLSRKTAAIEKILTPPVTQKPNGNDVPDEDDEENVNGLVDDDEDEDEDEEPAPPAKKKRAE